MKKRKSAKKEEKRRILVTYKGSAEMGLPFQDDSLILSLVGEWNVTPLACAIVNFPAIDGKPVFFIHDIVSYAGKEMQDFLYRAVLGIARERGYQEIYISCGRFAEKFMKENGFQKISGGILAKKELCE